MEIKQLIDNKNIRYEYFIGFESFGVSFTIWTESENLLVILKEKIRIILPNEFTETFKKKSEKNFYIKRAEEYIPEAEGIVYEMYEISDEKSEFIFRSDKIDLFFDLLDSKLRITVAEFAREKVFIHAGAVGYNGFGIIIPGKSFQGKTTLVANLIQKGALYYSDEYAVLDEEGLLHPFHKKLSMRGIIDDFTQKDIGYEEFKAKKGTQPVPIKLILLAGYFPGEIVCQPFKPEIISEGRGMLEMLANTIPIINNTKFTLKVLNKVVNRAIIAKCRRGDAELFAELLLNYFEDKIN